MTDVYIRAEYQSIERPFCLEGREHTMAETIKWTICSLSADNARLLSENGIGWRDGEPDWVVHAQKIALMQAQKDKADAEKRIAKLEASK